MITVILTLIDSIGTSDYTDYIARTTTVGTTLIGDGIEAGAITDSTLMICIIVLLFLIAHLSDRKWSYPRVEEQLGSMSKVEEEKETSQTEYTKTEEDMKN
jgi:amino acid permease